MNTFRIVLLCLICNMKGAYAFYSAFYSEKFCKFSKILFRKCLYPQLLHSSINIIELFSSVYTILAVSKNRYLLLFLKGRRNFVSCRHRWLSVGKIFFETTKPILLKFLPYIPHILRYVLNLKQVKFLFFTIFVCAKNSEKTFFSETFRHFEIFSSILLVEVQDIAAVVLNLKLFALSISDDPSWRNHLRKWPTYFSKSCVCLTFSYTKAV